MYVDATIEVGLSKFGLIPYGHKIVGNLYFSRDLINKEKLSDGCNENIGVELPKTPKVDESPIVVMERGGCSFVTKVLNAENSFAHAVIVIDNENTQKVDSIIMADDGRGNEVNIPSVIISQQDGLILKNYMRVNHNLQKSILIEMEFNMEQSDFVTYDLWYTPDQESIYILLDDFSYYQNFLGNAANLNIHFVFYPHRSTSGRFDNKSEYQDCLGSGRYCIRGQNGSDGRVILREAIKQRCIYDYSMKNKAISSFWSYMKLFYEECILKDLFKDNTCSNYITNKAGLPAQTINQCMIDAVIMDETEKEKKKKGVEYDKFYPIKFFEEDLELRKAFFISKTPTLYINSRPYLGTWRADYVFGFICAALKKKPEICFKEGGFIKEEPVSSSSLFLIIFIIVVTNVLIFLICVRVIRNKIQERLDASDINKKIDTVVNSYLQMRETK